MRLYAEHLEVWYGQRRVDRLPRLRGEGKHSIRYRDIIDRLVRKPGAFENYRYRDDLFPTHRFRMAYDFLRDRLLAQATTQYLRILELAARDSELAVDDALRRLTDQGRAVSFEAVEAIIKSGRQVKPATAVIIRKVDLAAYDALLGVKELAVW